MGTIAEAMDMGFPRTRGDRPIISGTGDSYVTVPPHTRG